MKYRNIIFGLFALFLLGACEDDLNIERNIGNVTLESYYNAEQSAVGSVLACYEPMQEASRIFNSDIGWGNIGTPEHDKGGSDASDQPDMTQKERYKIDAANAATTDRYMSGYQGIYAANVVLTNLPANEVLDPDLKVELLGEAYFLRAYYYFDMAKLFGGVRLVKPGMDAKTITESPRATVEETYEFIFEDLDLAIAGLPWEREAETLGRAIKGSALGYAVRAAMTINDYEKAAAYAEQLFLGPNELMPSFGAYWEFSNEWCTESLFEINYQRGAATGWKAGEANIWTTAFGPRSAPELQQTGWGFSMFQKDFIESWPDNDPRKELTYFLAKGDTLKDDAGIPTGEFSGQPYGDGYFIRKIAAGPYNSSYPISVTATDNEPNMRLLRLADVYLMYAEAQYELGNEPSALEYLGKVRDRAIASAEVGAPDVIAAIDGGLSGTALRDAIRQERIWELSGEGVRYYDILRHGLAGDLLVPMGFVTGKHELAPLPENAITLNKGVIKQNPNY